METLTVATEPTGGPRGTASDGTGGSSAGSTAPMATNAGSGSSTATATGADASTTTGLPFEDGYSPPPAAVAASEEPVPLGTEGRGTHADGVVPGPDRLAQDLRRVVATIDAAGDEDDRVRRPGGTGLFEDLREDDDLDRPPRSSTVATSIVEPARVMTRREDWTIPPTVTLAWSASSARSPV